MAPSVLARLLLTSLALGAGEGAPPPLTATRGFQDSSASPDLNASRTFHDPALNPDLKATRLSPEGVPTPDLKASRAFPDACPADFALVADPALRAPRPNKISLRNKALAASATAHGAVIGGATAYAFGEREKARAVAKEKEEERKEEIRKKKPFASLKKAPPKEAKKLALPTKQELLKRAQEALAAWKKTGKLPDDFDFGRFLMESELVDNPSRNDEHAADTFALKGDLRKQVAAAEGWDQAVEALLGYEKNYCADYALLGDFFRNGCGNCEANTKLLVSNFHDTKREPPPGLELGLQLFADHIQPVLVNKQSRAVTAIYSGTAYDPTPTPVYRPEMLLQAYLDKNEVKTGITQADLMMVDADVPLGANPNDPTNSNLSMEFKRGAAFSKKKAAKFATNGRGGGGGGGDGSDGDGDEASLDEWYASTKTRPPTAYELKRDAGTYATSGFFYSSLDHALISNDPSLLTAWKQAGNGRAARELLLGRMHDASIRIFQSGGLAKLRKLLEDPSGFADLTASDADEILAGLNGLTQYYSVGVSPFTVGAPQIETSPGYRILKKGIADLARDMNKDPEAWLQNLDILSPGTVANVLRVLAFPFSARGFDEPYTAIHNLVTNGTKVDTFRPLTSGNLDQFDTMLEIDFSGGKPHGTFYHSGKTSPDQSIAAGNTDGKGEIPRARPDAKIEILPETMAGILLSWNNPGFTDLAKNNGFPSASRDFPYEAAAQSLWSSALTKEKQEKFKSLDYDLGFARLVHDARFLHAFTDPKIRERYRDLKFVRVSFPNAQYHAFLAPPGLTHLNAPPPFELNAKDQVMPSVMPAEIAEAYRESLGRLFPDDKIEMDVEPLTLPAALDALKGPAPKPYDPPSNSTATHTNPFGMGGIPGSMQGPPTTPYGGAGGYNQPQK